MYSFYMHSGKGTTSVLKNNLQIIPGSKSDVFKNVQTQ